MKLCIKEGCDQKHIARGYCQKHYNAVRRSARREKSGKSENNIICSLNGCDSLAEAKGLCNKHYSRKIRADSKQITEAKKRDKVIPGGPFWTVFDEHIFQPWPASYANMNGPRTSFNL